MPIQAPQWTDYLNCPVCCREFGAPPRSPISLSCGHTICKHCLAHLHRRQCPFDQAVIQLEPEELVVNTALLQLAGYTPPAQPYHPPCIQPLPELERQAYDVVVHCIEELATYLKYCGNASSNSTGARLSRPMQRKLVTLVQCAITDPEGRGRTARAARSLGERTVTELILQHQNPQQLSANLWAAVRARGCQFLGPAMQEEVLKLVLLALEDGSALSRKVLVLFIVQRLEPHFPQASKTSIGHVVQLLYRASCFKVSKRECDSSLMQLKEEFRTYESLRREHDAQIVQIATEAGLRIAPDQWSALLYGDAVHKSQMQSIIDKLQSPQSFAQSIQELFISLQRTGDPTHLGSMNVHLDRLAGIDASPDANSPTWVQLAEVLTSLREVVSGLVQYLQQQGVRDANHNRTMDPNAIGMPFNNLLAVQEQGQYQLVVTWEATTQLSTCPPNTPMYVPTEQEFERHRNSQVGSPNMNMNMNGNFAYLHMPPPQVSGGPHMPPPPPTSGIVPQPPMYPPPFAMMHIPPPPLPQQQPAASAGHSQHTIGSAGPSSHQHHAVSSPGLSRRTASSPGPSHHGSLSAGPSYHPNMLHRRTAPPPSSMPKPSFPHPTMSNSNGQMPKSPEMNQNGLRHGPVGIPRPQRFDYTPPFLQPDVSYFSDLPPVYHDMHKQKFNAPMPFQNNAHAPTGNVASGSSSKPVSELVMASTTHALADMNSRGFLGEITAQGQVIIHGPRALDSSFAPVQPEKQGSGDLSPYLFDNTSDWLSDSYRSLDPRRSSPWAPQEEDTSVFSFDSMQSTLPRAGTPFPQAPPQPQPQQMAQPMMQAMPQQVPKQMPPSMPQNMPSQMPQHMPSQMPQHMPSQMPQHMPSQMPQHMPSQMPQNMAVQMPQQLPLQILKPKPQQTLKAQRQDEVVLEHEILALERRLDEELDKESEE